MKMVMVMIFDNDGGIDVMIVIQWSMNEWGLGSCIHVQYGIEHFDEKGIMADAY